MIPTILKATKNLQTSSDPSTKEISVFKDLTKEDRAQRKKLVTEMKAKNESLKNQIDPATGQAVTDRWIIRGDSLVFVNKDMKPKHV